MEPDFLLYEALLWEPERGYRLFERHLARLVRSATHFGFACDRAAIESELEAFGAALGRRRKVRLELARDGGTFVEDVDLKPSRTVTCALGETPVDSSDPFLRHKTSRREVYERALAAHPGCDDVLLFNERGELTESCTSNVLVELGGAWLTPPVACGLLPGTLREHLLETGEVREAIVSRADLARAERVQIANSVRGRCDARLSPPAAAAR